MRSIVQEKDGRCYLCEIFKNDYSKKDVLEVHHVFYGTANHKLSEKWGLKVFLCVEHHRTTKDAVHQNHNMDMFLKDRVQRVFENKYPTKDFVSIFGKNFKITDKEREECVKRIKGELV